jgi:uncharacterized C2H2 Zn-finger protein
MSVYNILKTTLGCPRCGETSEMEVDLYFGFRDLIVYKIGDTCRWAKKGGPSKGGRPPNGTCDGDSYAECPRCKKDFFVLTKIESDKIRSAEPDLTREPYIKD